MAMSTSPSVQIDIGEAFGYVFRSRNWFGKLAGGALCLAFFWVLVPLFILLGYGVETARAVSRGERELPPWTDISTKLTEGFMLAVALFIWELPGSILSGGGGASGSNAFTALGGLYSFLLGFLMPAIWSQFLDGGFTAAFDFRAVFRRAGYQPGMTVLVWLMAIVAGIVGGLGVIALGIGLLFTLPYAFAVTAHLYAQFHQRTESVTTAMAL